ncbi:MAG: M23 family metallopeptidase [Actinomycetia bacterium]|nr:M23 family metallopeptidase [Actinomycetes bacterium]
MTPAEQRPCSRLAPARDTGLTVGGGLRGGRRRRRSLAPVFAIVAALAVGAAMLASAAGNRSATRAVVPAETTASVPVAATNTAEALREPTPAFAAYRSLSLRLPVDPGDVTALAYHQASGNEALHLCSLVPDADMAAAAKVKAVAASDSASVSAETTAVETVWRGTVLRLWRSNRSGKPDTAADVGADPGSIVYSPVTGTVLQVRAYKLYNKYPDYEIHIRPDGWPEVDVVLIHVDDIAVTAGDWVIGGASHVACVRKMSDKIDIQLGGYTQNGGDHVHVQLNRVAVPGKLEPLSGS